MKHQTLPTVEKIINRREILVGTVAAVTTARLALGGKPALANTAPENGKKKMIPKAFVYTEVQFDVPFKNAPWQARKPILKQQKGLISKLWLSGLNTNTLAGVDAFDTVENARAFAIDDFPKTAAKLNAAFYTRVFDASVAEAASRGLSSPDYT